MIGCTILLVYAYPNGLKRVKDPRPLEPFGTHLLASLFEKRKRLFTL